MNKINFRFLGIFIIVLIFLITIFSLVGTSKIQTDAQINEISLIDINNEILKTQKFVVDTKTVVDSINSKINFLIILVILNILATFFIIFLLFFKKRINKKGIETKE